MPIDYCIDHARQLVSARGSGTFSGAEIFAYQKEVWSRPEVSAYNELVDVSAVEHFTVPIPSGPNLEQLAHRSAQDDDPTKRTKFAIVAPSELGYGLGRMYQSYREIEPRSNKEVGVFRTLDEALNFLGVDSLDAACSPADCGRIDR